MAKLYPKNIQNLYLCIFWRLGIIVNIETAGDERPMHPKHILIALAVTTLWGFNFSVIKLGVGEMDPLILAGFRFTFAAFPALLFFPRPNVSWRLMASYGMLFGVGVWGIMNLAIHSGVSAGMAGLILEFTVFISALFGVLFLKESLSRFHWVGFALALIGLGLILGIEDGSVTTIGVVLGLVAAVAWSCISLLIRKAQIKQMFGFIVWSAIFAPIPLFGLAFVLNGSAPFVALAGLDHLGFFSIFFQAFITTLLGYWAWNRLMTIYPMTVIAPFNLLVPVFGLVGSALFYNEVIGSDKLLACALITLAVVIPMLEPLYKRLVGSTSTLDLSR